MAVRKVTTTTMVGGMDAPEVEQKPDFYRAVGTGGIRMAGGYVGADFLPQLQGRSAAKIYRQMSDNDPLLSAVVYTLSMLTRQVAWRVEPASTDEADVSAARWLEKELMEKMRTPWAQVMADAATMFTYGYAPCEVTLAKRPEGDIGVDRIALRAQETVQRWAYDEQTREAIGFWQQTDDMPQCYIPLVKCLLFRTEATRGNPEGKSILRGSYVTWVRKRAVEEAEGRAALRSAGLVVIRVPGKLMSPAASGEDRATLAAMQSLAERVADDRQGSVILPTDMDKNGGGVRQFDIEYKMADGRRPADMSPIIERMDKRMAGSVLADFILLGQQAIGSFALSSDKTALFSTALGAFLDIIEGEINRSLVPLLWRVNSFDEETIPKVKHSDVEKRNLTELSTYISTLAASGAQLFPDDELEKYLRTEGGLPERATQEGLGDGFSPPDEPEIPEEPEEPEEPKKRATKRPAVEREEQPDIDEDEKPGLKKSLEEMTRLVARTVDAMAESVRVAKEVAPAPITVRSEIDQRVMERIEDQGDRIAELAYALQWFIEKEVPPAPAPVINIENIQPEQRASEPPTIILNVPPQSRGPVIAKRGADGSLTITPVEQE